MKDKKALETFKAMLEAVIYSCEADVDIAAMKAKVESQEARLKATIEDHKKALARCDEELKAAEGEVKAEKAKAADIKKAAKADFEKRKADADEYEKKIQGSVAKLNEEAVLASKKLRGIETEIKGKEKALGEVKEKMRNLSEG